MSAPGVILGCMEAGANPAWVSPDPKGAAAARSGKDVALALRLLDQSARAWQLDRDYSFARNRDAVRLLGPDTVLASLNLQEAGKFPMCGTAEWERLVALAEDGRVTVAPVFLIGADGYVCEDVVENRICGRAAKSPAVAPDPASLRDEFRKMGLV